MSSPLMKLVCVRTTSVVKRAARLLPTQRISTRRFFRIAPLQRNGAAFLCRLVSTFLGAVALGGFFGFHESSVFFLAPRVTPNHP